MGSSVSPKDEMWFLRVYHHISTGLYIGTWRFIIHFLSSLALRPNAGYIFLIHEIYRSHTMTHHALVWTSDQLFAETSTWQHTTLTETDIHDLAGFELTISASEQPQTNALDRAPTGIGSVIHKPYIYIYIRGVTGGTDQTSGGCSLC